MRGDNEIVQGTDRSSHFFAVRQTEERLIKAYITRSSYIRVSDLEESRGHSKLIFLSL